MEVKDFTVATEIQRQIGNKAFYMLGAQNLVADSTSLSFRIRGSKVCSHIQIALNGSDLYDMTFMKISRLNIKNKKTFENIYVDQLHQIIEQETGLYTKL